MPLVSHSVTFHNTSKCLSCER